MSKKIGNRIISALIIVALLATVMICQIVSAWSEEKDANPAALASANFTDYYVKTQKVYFNDDLYATATYNYNFNDDGTINVEAIAAYTANESTTTQNYTIQKEYDDEDRLISFKTIIDDPAQNVTYGLSYDGDGQYIINQVVGDDLSIDLYTYDPETKAFYRNGWMYEYDENGRKIKKSLSNTSYGTHETIYSYQTDPVTGKDIKKNYTVFERGTQTASGSVDITYSGDLTIHTETIDSDEDTRTIRTTYDQNNRLIKIEEDIITYNSNDGWIDENLSQTLYDYSYDEVGNLISQKAVSSYNGIPSMTILQEYTYEYHPHATQKEMTAILASEKGKNLLFKQFTDLSVQMQNGEPSDYLFKFIVYNKDSNQWYKLRDFGESTEFNWYTGPVGHKVLYVDIVDKEAYQTDPENALKDKMRISLDDIVVTDYGFKVDSFESSEGTELAMKTHTTLTATASNGEGDLQYKFIVYNEDNGQWYKIQDYSPENTCDWYTGPAGNKTLYVDVKDSNDVVVRGALEDIVVS